MKNVLAMVLAGGRVDELSVLTLSRPKSAVPFGGMYRVIDFTLSNLMHSGIEKVGILSQYRSFSLLNHVGVGAWWDFLGRNRGATMLLPSTGHKMSDWYKGTADAVYQNLEFVREHAPKTVMILSGDHIYNMDYRPMLRYHLDKDADLTCAFFHISPQDCSRFGMAALDDQDDAVGGRVVDYREKPETTDSRWASLTIYLFKSEVLFEVLAENAEHAESHQFGRDILTNMFRSYRVYGYKFSGYWGYTRTIDEYWQTNMDLLGDNPKIDLEAWQVRTNLDHDRLRDRPPAKVAPAASIENSLIHNGCDIAGEVSNSILFPGVSIAEGSIVRNSILFFDTKVGPGSYLDKTITDFDVRIGRECYIGDGNSSIPNNSYPGVLESGINLIGKGAALPPKLYMGRNCIVAPGLQEKSFEIAKYESGMTVT